jgi:hypothetical protein
MRHKSIIAIGLLIAAGIDSADASGSEFTTIDDRSHPPGYYTDPEVRRKLAEESRPAGLDLEGNWGLPVEGVQLSMRLERTVYEVGEPIGVTFLIRNVSDQRVVFSQTYPENDFKLIATQGRSLAPPTPRAAEPQPGSVVGRILPHSRQRELQPWQQIKYVMRLTDVYELNAVGEYVIYAKRLIPKLKGTGVSEVRSGNAIIRVVADQAPEVREPNASNSFQSPGTAEKQTANGSKSNESKAADVQKSTRASSPDHRNGSTPDLPTSSQVATADPPAPAPASRSPSSFGFGSRAGAMSFLLLALLVFGWVFLRSR